TPRDRGGVGPSPRETGGSRRDRGRSGRPGPEVLSPSRAEFRPGGRSSRLRDRGITPRSTSPTRAPLNAGVQHMQRRSLRSPYAVLGIAAAVFVASSATLAGADSPADSTARARRTSAFAD